MCWKHEWAKAINNLNRAITFVERAQKSLEERLARNRRHLNRLRENKKYNYPANILPVEERIKKNQNGIEECKQIIADLKERQSQLYCLIHTIGISHGETSQTVYELMGNYPPASHHRTELAEVG